MGVCKTAQFAPESKSISSFSRQQCREKGAEEDTSHQAHSLSAEYKACVPDAHFICSLPFHVYFKISQKLSYSSARNYFFQPWEATVCHPVDAKSRKKTSLL